MSLKQKALTGIKWTTLSTLVVALLQFLQLAILARLFSVSDFGLVAIIMVVVGFAQAFMDMGISNAIIHKQTVTKSQLSTLYWLNVISGVVVFLIVCMFSPLIAQFYSEPELMPLIIWVAMSFLIQPFGQQFLVLWQKELRFDEIAIIEIINKLVVLLVSVGLAFLGYGVYSLVYGILLGTIVNTLLFFFKGVKEYPIQLVFKLKEVNSFLSFGFYQMAEKTINYFHSQIDTLLIGKLMGVEVLGGYSIAKQLIMKPAQIINPVASKVTFPIMAKVQHDNNILKSIYLKQINLLASINFPIYTFITVMAINIVTLLFGEKWLEVVPIVQILCLYGALRSVMSPVGTLLLAKGRADMGFYWNLTMLFYIPLVIYFISPFGLKALSWGLVFVMFSLVTPMWFFLIKKLCGVGFMDYHKHILIPAVISLLTGVVAFFAKQGIGVTHIFMELLLIATLSLLLLFFLNYFFNRAMIVDIKQFFKK